MQEEMQRCAREGTPRPESSAVRAHAPNAFWAFADSWKAIFHSGVCDHAIKDLCRVYISRTVKCEFCGNQRSEQGDQGRPRGDAVRRAAELREAPTGTTSGRRPRSRTPRRSPGACPTTRRPSGSRLHAHFSEPELVELGCAIALTFGQQSWIRLLGIDHHQYLAGTDASMAPGLPHRRGARRDQGPRRLLGQALTMTEQRIGWPATEEEVLVEQLPGSDRPAHYFLAETLDGLYTPYALQRPPGPGPHPFVFLAYGNGGGGMDWLRDRVHRLPVRGPTYSSTPVTPARGPGTAPRSSSATRPAARCARTSGRGWDS